MKNKMKKISEKQCEQILKVSRMKNKEKSES